jgi:hypothetical protein
VAATRDLLVPTTRHKLGGQAVLVSGPMVFNALPTELETYRSIVDSKRKFITFAFPPRVNLTLRSLARRSKAVQFLMTIQINFGIG